MAELPIHITLAHELIHAEQKMRGEALPSSITVVDSKHPSYNVQG